MLPTTSPARLNAIAVSDAWGVGARDFSGTMDLLENIYAVLGIILLPLVFLALLVAAFLPKERCKKVLQRLRRMQF